MTSTFKLIYQWPKVSRNLKMGAMQAGLLTSSGPVGMLRTIRHRMRFLKLPSLLVLACIGCACTQRESTGRLTSSVSTIHKYADSFVGLSITEARGKLANGKVSEDQWSNGGFGGKQLLAAFPGYEVRLMFLGDKVLTASVRISSK